MSASTDTLLEAGVTVYEGIDLLGFEIVDRTDEGELIHHCGKPISVGTGIFGADVLTCKECGAQMVKFTSPHVNGGICFSDEMFARIGDREWHLSPAVEARERVA